MSYKAEIIADSTNQFGNRITTFVVTYPRIIHAEMCRHRIHSRNTASSRAIPFKKMAKDVEENPFIPIAWQKGHKGMQGTEYFTNENEIAILKYDWLRARDSAVHWAKYLSENGITKQLCNRLLEPFVWTTEIITGTEWENFFNLRCPLYFEKYRSWKDACVVNSSLDFNAPILERLENNSSQADIHIQAIAELMWDKFNESTPKQLRAGEWHIPFGDNIEKSKLSLLHYGNIESTTNVEALYNNSKIKIATARCARISYINFKGKDDYEADIKLHDRLLAMEHMSPAEHCAKAMSSDQYNSYVSGKLETVSLRNDYNQEWEEYCDFPDEKDKGWCRNFKGFISYRHLIEEK